MIWINTTNGYFKKRFVLLWHYIKYYFLMNLFQDVNERDSGKFFSILGKQRGYCHQQEHFVFQESSKTFNQWTPRYTPTISLALQTQLKKHGSIIIQSKKPFKGLSPIITYVVTRLVTRDPAGELDIGDQDRLRHGLIDLGVIEKSVEPPKCSILMFLTA